VAKQSTQQKQEKSSANKNRPYSKEAWLPTRAGLITVGVISILLAAWITIQATKVSNLGESLLWGLGFGGSIWLVFGVVYFVNRFLRNR